MSLRDLQQRRAAIVLEMRQITDKPTGTGGDLSAEQAQKFDALKAELEGLETRIARQAFIDEAERRAQGQKIHGSGDDRLDEQLREFSLRKAICLQVPDLAAQVDCGKERELSAELAKRAGRPMQGVVAPLAVFQMPLERRTLTGGGGSPDSGGINLVGSNLRGDLFVDALRARMITRRLGARVISGLQGNLDVPKQASAAAATWIADDSGLSSGDPTFQKISFSPKHCGCLTEYSRAMLLQSSPDVEALLRSDFAKVLAGALDIASINGAGSNDPTGILNTTGIGSVAGPVSWAKILEMIETLEEANANADAAGWAMTAGMKRLLRSTVRVSSTDSRMLMESANELAGYRAETSSNVPSTLGSPAESDALIFGDWSDLLIATWDEFSLLANPFATGPYSRGGVQVRGLMSVDLAPRHAESFVAMTNVSPG
ncbi:MAG: hypothetical protein A3G81_26020 [Betaproteobacteria bacterium RIFCSPLOWO2_12_FULL_65_14]|nr:MAG: hypothetical protein A3G81_26020 [Betaproteobacteria bacterium RIFCSPLOWO2_12_FULL_65_14]